MFYATNVSPSEILCMVPLPQVNQHLLQFRNSRPSMPTMIAGASDVAHTQSEVSIDTAPAIEIAFYYLLV